MAKPESQDGETREVRDGDGEEALRLTGGGGHDTFNHQGNETRSVEEEMELRPKIAAQCAFHIKKRRRGNAED